MLFLFRAYIDRIYNSELITEDLPIVWAKMKKKKLPVLTILTPFLRENEPYRKLPYSHHQVKNLTGGRQDNPSGNIIAAKYQIPLSSSKICGLNSLY